MGGLAARSYLQQISFSDPKVAQLITVGTPHRGADIAKICSEWAVSCQLLADVFGVPLDLGSLAVAELRPDSSTIMTLNDLLHHPLSSEVDYVSIIGRGTPVLGSGGQDGDGIVTVTSQDLGNICQDTGNF